MGIHGQKLEHSLNGFNVDENGVDVITTVKDNIILQNMEYFTVTDMGRYDIYDIMIIEHSATNERCEFVCRNIVTGDIKKSEIDMATDEYGDYETSNLVISNRVDNIIYVYTEGNQKLFKFTFGDEINVEEYTLPNITIGEEDYYVRIYNYKGILYFYWRKDGSLYKYTDKSTCSKVTALSVYNKGAVSFADNYVFYNYSSSEYLYAYNIDENKTISSNVKCGYVMTQYLAKYEDKYIIANASNGKNFLYFDIPTETMYEAEVTPKFNASYEKCLYDDSVGYLLATNGGAYKLTFDGNSVTSELFMKDVVISTSSSNESKLKITPLGMYYMLYVAKLNEETQLYDLDLQEFYSYKVTAKETNDGLNSVLLTKNRNHSVDYYINDIMSLNPVTAEDIVEGKEAFVNGEKIIGNATIIEKNTAVSYDANFISNDENYNLEPTAVVPFNTFLQEGAEVGVIVTNEQLANRIQLTPEKIVKGNTILGVEGTAETSGTEFNEFGNMLIKPSDLSSVSVLISKPLNNILHRELLTSNRTQIYLTFGKLTIRSDGMVIIWYLFEYPDLQQAVDVTINFKDTDGNIIISQDITIPPTSNVQVLEIYNTMATYKIEPVEKEGQPLTGDELEAEILKIVDYEIRLKEAE